MSAPPAVRTSLMNLTEISARLNDIAESHDRIYESLAALEQKIDQIIEIVRTSANAATEVTQERVDLVRRVAKLEHEVELLKGSAA